MEQSLRRIAAIAAIVDRLPASPDPAEGRAHLVKVARAYLRSVDLGMADFPGHLSSAGLYVLIELFIAGETRQQISISTACTAARVPATTALRCLTTLVDDGLIRRLPDRCDKRRQLVELTKEADKKITAWLGSLAAICNA